MLKRESQRLDIVACDVVARTTGVEVVVGVLHMVYTQVEKIEDKYYGNEESHAESFLSSGVAVRRTTSMMEDQHHNDEGSLIDKLAPVQWSVPYGSSRNAVSLPALHQECEEYASTSVQSIGLRCALSLHTFHGRSARHWIFTAHTEAKH